MAVKTPAAKTRKPTTKPPREDSDDLQPGLMGEDDVPKSRKVAPEVRKSTPTLFDVGEDSLETAASEISSLKVRLARQLGDIEQGLMGEFARLEAVQKAVAEAEARVAELHAINAEAGTLAALREAHELEKKSFRLEMDEVRASWEKEQRDHEAQVKERDATSKKERAREEEEYQYQTKQRRQREADAVAADLALKRQNFEESVRERDGALTTREETLKVREQELADLRKQVATFPGQLEKEVRATEARATVATEERFEFEKKLLEKDIEHERKMFQAAILSLQEKSKEQDARIKALEKDLKDSVAQAQSVTARAIEGIAGMRPAPAAPEPVREPQEPRR
jgi:hypothetical protein